MPQGVYLSENKKQVFIPKLKWVGIDLHREFKGEIKTVTISKTVTNKYFVSILIETKTTIPKRKPIKDETSVGVDLGIKDFCITSDGEVFENKKYFVNSQQKLRVEQRSLARKKKGSNNYNKQKLVVALLYEKIKNQRRDYLHKISHYLISNYDTICIEDLAVKNMMQNHKFAKAIGDVGWRMFRTMLEYKAIDKGKNISVIGRFDPSSKICSNCGAIKQYLKLSDRIYKCKNCETEIDRDINASKNIKTFGLRNKPSIAKRKAIV